MSLYAFAFLRHPIGDGFVTADGEPISRGGFVFSAFFLPDEIVSTWHDDGRLPIGLADRWPLALATLAWLGLATGWGFLVMGKSVEARLAFRMEKMSMAALVGLALLSTLTLMVGWLVGLTATRLGSAIVLAIAATWALRIQRTKTVSAEQTLQPVDTLSDELATSHTYGIFDRCLQMASIVLVCMAGCLTMLGAWVPAVEFDVLEYHLQAPKEFFQSGSIGFVPHNIYANMPLGAEMHSLAMMTFVGQNDGWLGGMMGKSIIASISLLGAVLLGAVVAQRWGANAGWSAAGIWLATPGIAHVAMLGLVDGVLATYVLATSIVLMRAIYPQRLVLGTSKPVSTRNEWFIAGLMGGASAAIKYPGLVFGVAPVGAALVWSFYHRRASGKNDWLACGLAMMLGVAGTAFPWYAKNWMLAGNPVYPLAANIFHGSTLTNSKISQWQQAHRVPPAPVSSASGPLGRTGAILSQLINDGLRIVLRSPYVQPAMVIGVAIACWIVYDHRSRHWPFIGVWLVWSLWIVGVWWLATHRIDRFWLPLTGLWAGASAVGLLWFRQRVSPWLAHAVLVLGLAYGCLLNSTQLISDNRFFVSMEALRADVGPKIKWINQHLSQPNTRLLAIGEAGVFPYTVPLIYGTCFDMNPGETLLRDRTSDQQRSALKEIGITHILINWTEIGRYRSPGNYGFSDWPQIGDIQRMIDEGVVHRVDWSISNDAADLLEVK